MKKENNAKYKDFPDFWNPLYLHVDIYVKYLHKEHKHPPYTIFINAD